MTTPTRIRRLDPANDLGELTRLLHRAYADLARQGLRYVATHQDLETTRNRVADGACFVAERDGRIVGTIVFHDAVRTSGCEIYDRPGVASFHQFGVEPSLQGHGIGEALLAHVERVARESGATGLALDTADGAHSLIEMYERRGYVCSGHADWDETNYRSVVLLKELKTAPPPRPAS